MGGVLRVITNKPNPDAVSAGIDLETNHYSGGAWGGSAEGFVNLPVGNGAALRVVGWYVRDGGYVDNRFGSRRYSTGITVDNAPYARNDYNYADTYGGRAALAVPLGENWTITPSIVAQQTRRNGSAAYVPGYGDLVTEAYTQEDGNDRWYQAALTVAGEIGNFDLIYSGSYLDRKTTQHVNYADYDYYYDQQYAIFPSGGQRVNNAGQPIDPRDTLINNERFTKQAHELRITSPSTNPFRFVAGAFYQRQAQGIDLDYNVPGIADRLAVSGHPGTTFLTREERIDRDYALFGQVDLDVVRRLTLTAGGRYYRYDNSLFGFFGTRANEAFCFSPAIVARTPCTNLGTPSGGSAVPRRVKDDGFTYRLGAQFNFTRDNMLYFTVADGFRPGGTNRLGERGQQNLGSATVPYGPDTLTNYELGTKNLFWNRRAKLNIVLFNQEWHNIQLGTAINGVNLIQNVARARSRGVEVTAGLEPVTGLNLTVNGAYIDAKLLGDYTVAGQVIVPSGSRLAYSPRFKANGIARYSWEMGSDIKPFVQIAQSYQSNVVASFSFSSRTFYDDYPPYGITDLSLGFNKGRLQIEGYATNVFDNHPATYRSYLFYQGPATYYQYTVRPRRFGIRAGYRF